MLMVQLRQPLVLIPQYFGCLVFERRTSRYLPFDREATTLLLRLCKETIGAVVASVAGEEREALLRFCDAFRQRGFFDLQGRMMADVLNVPVPEDHLAG